MRDRGPVYVVLDGNDGVGKSTIVKALVEKLESDGFCCVSIREPDTLRAELLYNRNLNDYQRAIAFMADHEITIANAINRRGADFIISDRCALTSIPVYQKLTDEEADVLARLFDLTVQPHLIFVVTGEVRKEKDDTVTENVEKNLDFYDYLIRGCGIEIVNDGTVEDAVNEIIKHIDNLSLYQNLLTP